MNEEIRLTQIAIFKCPSDLARDEVVLGHLADDHDHDFAPVHDHDEDEPVTVNGDPVKHSCKTIVDSDFVIQSTVRLSLRRNSSSLLRTVH